MSKTNPKILGKTSWKTSYFQSVGFIYYGRQWCAQPPPDNPKKGGTFSPQNIKILRSCIFTAEKTWFHTNSRYYIVCFSRDKPIYLVLSLLYHCAVTGSIISIWTLIWISNGAYILVHGQSGTASNRMVLKRVRPCFCRRGSGNHTRRPHGTACGCRTQEKTIITGGHSK